MRGLWRKGWLGAAAGMAFILVACADDPAGLAGEIGLEDPAVLAAMAEALQDEFKAELTYLGVMEDFGQVRPFSNIIFAEERHSVAITRLYENRGLSAPSSDWTPEEIPAFSSVAGACAAGVQAEIGNAAIYDRYLALPLPADVRTVFESNRSASLDNHLPAFRRCAG